MSDMESRLKKLATTIYVKAQQKGLTSPMAAGGGDMGGMPTSAAGEGGPVEGAMGATIPGAEGADMAPMEAPPEEAPADEEGKKEELDSPTPWIVKFHNDNFWIGKVFPAEYIEEAVKFFSQRKSVPKEQVREYLEKLKEGKKEEMPPEFQQALEVDEMAAAGGAPAAPAAPGGPAPAAGGEAGFMSQMPKV